jgi:hypothetical protein
MVRNMVIFYGEELLAPRPTHKLKDHPLSAVRDWLFNKFAAAPSSPRGRSSNRQLLWLQGSTDHGQALQTFLIIV